MAGVPSQPSWPLCLESVPRLYPDSTIVCLGSGPSLTQEDVDEVYESGAHMIAINDAWRLTGTKADVLFAADAQWWQWHQDVPDTDLPWHLWAVDPEARKWRRFVHLVNYNGKDGLETAPHSIRTGGHSGYMAINLAVHLGASKIILLGYDLQAHGTKHHFCGNHPDGRHLNYEVRGAVYATLVEPLASLGIEIINASRASLLTAFPVSSLERALE